MTQPSTASKMQQADSR